MEVLNKEKEVIIEMAPNFLLYCLRHIPKKIRNEFPILMDLEFTSKKWIDELQVFQPSKITELNKELLRLYRIVNMEEFIPEIEASKIVFHWTDNDYQLRDINEDISTLINFFSKLIELELEIKIYL